MGAGLSVTEVVILTAILATHGLWMSLRRKALVIAEGISELRKNVEVYDLL